MANEDERARAGMVASSFGPQLLEGEIFMGTADGTESSRSVAGEGRRQSRGNVRKRRGARHGRSMIAASSEGLAHGGGCSGMGSKTLPPWYSRTAAAPPTATGKQEREPETRRTQTHAARRAAPAVSSELSGGRHPCTGTRRDGRAKRVCEA
ncbi:uncharacterized protein BKA78DRAFT_51361 [Phyllosticta capitalensis]|uniref:uncharacterized protein n=1 Tax=Phyllosticta capitalensis TaxID=121624 RepID=UPI003130B213